MKVYPKAVIGGFGTLFMYWGILLVCGAMFLLVFQTHNWLRFGEWPPLTIASVCIWIEWYPQYTHWVGLDRMIGAVFDWSQSLTAFIVGVALYMLGMALGGEID